RQPVEGGEGVARAADDGFVAAVEGGVQDDRGAVALADLADETVVERVDVGGDGLRPGGAVVVDHGGHDCGTGLGDRGGDDHVRQRCGGADQRLGHLFLHARGERPPRLPVLDTDVDPVTGPLGVRHGHHAAVAEGAGAALGPALEPAGDSAGGQDVRGGGGDVGGLGVGGAGGVQDPADLVRA